MTDHTETRQGIGFPDWVIVQGSARLFPQYGETVTELGFVDDDGREVRLAVSDRDRKVIRAAFVGGGMPDLRNVCGLVRHFWYSDRYEHTEWSVAR